MLVIVSEMGRGRLRSGGREGGKGAGGDAVTVGRGRSSNVLLEGLKLRARGSVFFYNLVNVRRRTLLRKAKCEADVAQNGSKKFQPP